MISENPCYFQWKFLNIYFHLTEHWILGENSYKFSLSETILGDNKVATKGKCVTKGVSTVLCSGH